MRKSIDAPENMAVLLLFCGSAFKGECEILDKSLLDIAPTIADIMDIEPERDWTGRSLA